MNYGGTMLRRVLSAPVRERVSLDFTEIRWIRDCVSTDDIDCLEDHICNNARVIETLEIQAQSVQRFEFMQTWLKGSALAAARLVQLYDRATSPDEKVHIALDAMRAYGRFLRVESTGDLISDATIKEKMLTESLRWLEKSKQLCRPYLPIDRLSQANSQLDLTGNGFSQRELFITAELALSRVAYRLLKWEQDMDGQGLLQLSTVMDAVTRSKGLGMMHQSCLGILQDIGQAIERCKEQDLNHEQIVRDVASTGLLPAVDNKRDACTIFSDYTAFSESFLLRFSAIEGVIDDWLGFATTVLPMLNLKQKAVRTGKGVKDNDVALAAFLPELQRLQAVILPLKAEN